MLIKNTILKLNYLIKKAIPNFNPIPIYFSVEEINAKQKQKHPFTKQELSLLLDFELNRKSYLNINTDAVELYLNEYFKKY